MSRFFIRYNNRYIFPLRSQTVGLNQFVHYLLTYLLINQQSVSCFVTNWATISNEWEASRSVTSRVYSTSAPHSSLSCRSYTRLEKYFAITNWNMLQYVFECVKYVGKTLEYIRKHNVPPPQFFLNSFAVALRNLTSTILIIQKCSVILKKGI